MAVAGQLSGQRVAETEVEVEVVSMSGSRLCDLTVPRDCTTPELRSRISSGLENKQLLAADILLHGMDVLTLEKNSQPCQPLAETLDARVLLTVVFRDEFSKGDEVFYCGPMLLLRREVLRPSWGACQPGLSRKLQNICEGLSRRPRPPNMTNFWKYLTTPSPPPSSVLVERGARGLMSSEIGERPFNCAPQLSTDPAMFAGIVEVAFPGAGEDGLIKQRVHIAHLSRLRPAPVQHLPGGYAPGDEVFYCGPAIAGGSWQLSAGKRGIVKEAGVLPNTLQVHFCFWFTYDVLMSIDLRKLTREYSPPDIEKAKLRQ